ncbi:MAG TPA: glycosyltransferase family 87 protein [Candidatus Acidoferrales bacterium]|nr:glycosyltransferase family 87 protein [Candidatus Acidoferrales bacterium]
MAVMLCLNAAVLWSGREDIAAGRNDFPIFYSNAQMVREGQSSGLYDFDAENTFTHRVTNVARPPNNHLPYELLFFVPFTYLQFRAACVVWTILGLTMLAGVAFTMCGFRVGRCSFVLTFLTILAFYPEWYCLLQGQDSILLLCLFTLSFWLWRRGKDDWAGFVLALGLFRPQLVLPFVFIAFLAGQRKLVRGFIAGAALVLALSTWVVGLHGMADYARVLLAQGSQQSARALEKRWAVNPGLMPTWRGFLSVCLRKWVPSGLRTFFLLVGTFLGLAWAAKHMRRAKGKAAAAFDLAFAIALATTLLVSFHSFLNDFSLMILPFLICGPMLATSTLVPRKTGYLLVTLGFLFFSTPLYLALGAIGYMGWLFLFESLAVWLVSRWANDWRMETSNAITLAPECSVTT